MSTAYLVTGVRTPIGRYAGALADIRADDLAAHVLRALVDRLPEVALATMCVGVGQGISVLLEAV